MKSILSLAICVAFALPASSAEVDEVTEKSVGAWKLDFTTPEGEHKTPIIIVGRQREDLVAWYVAEDEPQEFTQVELDNQELKLTFRPEKFNGDIKVTFTGRLKETDLCEGSIDYETNDGDSGTFDFAGERMKPSEFDKTKTWDISFTTPDGIEREASVITLSKDGNTYGWYSSDDYELPAKEVSNSDDKLSISLTVITEDGDPIEVTFRGNIEGDEISGDAEYSIRSDSGSFAFTGKSSS